MSAARTRDWKAIAAIRLLQRRAAELAAARAGAEREAAADRRAEAEASAADAQDGWVAALDGAFDPGLARRWFGEVARREADAGEAGDALGEADRLLERKRVDWHAAEAREAAAQARHRSVSAGAARRREEKRLAEAEDRFGGQGRGR